MELGQPKDSMQESFQLFLPSFEKGGKFVNNSMYRRNNYGEKYDHVMHASFFDFMHSFTMLLQAMTPKRIFLSCKSHGKHWSTGISEFGHSLFVQRDILFHDGCFPKAPNISHIFSHGEITCAASKWWGNHLPYLDMMHAGDALHWYHMWDYDPPPHAQIFVCLYVVLLPYLDDIVLLFMGMYGGRMGSLYVPHGMENIFVSPATCFREIIGSAMFISFEFLTPYGMDYVHLIMTIQEQLMEDWIGEHLESLVHDGVTNVGGEVLQHSTY